MKEFSSTTLTGLSNAAFQGLSLPTAAQQMCFVRQTDQSCGHEGTTQFLQLQAEPCRAESSLTRSKQSVRRRHRVRVQSFSLRRATRRTEAFIMRHMLCMRSDKHTIFLHLQPGQAGWQVHLLLMEDTQHWLAESAQPLTDTWIAVRHLIHAHTHMQTKLCAAK